MNSNRRTFIKQSAVASAAVLLMPSCMTPTKNYEIGVGLYTVRDDMRVDPRGTLEKISRIGYTKVETVGEAYKPGKLYGFEAKEFSKILSDLGLKVPSGHFDLSVFQNGFEQLLDTVEEVGYEYVVMPWLNEEQRQSLDQYKSYAELLNKCGEQAKGRNLQVCYHNHDFEFIELDGQLPMDIILNETDPQLVEIELDLYWVTYAGKDSVDFFEKNSGRVSLWHVKDLAPNDRSMTEVGEGSIDFKSIFEKRKLSGLKHFFVEQDLAKAPFQSLETSYKNLTKDIL